MHSGKEGGWAAGPQKSHLSFFSFSDPSWIFLAPLQSGFRGLFDMPQEPVYNASLNLILNKENEYGYSGWVQSSRFHFKV